MYYCSINLIRQSEHSGLRPDTSSLVPVYIALAMPISLVQSVFSGSNNIKKLKDLV